MMVNLNNTVEYCVFCFFLAVIYFHGFFLIGENWIREKFPNNFNRVEHSPTAEIDFGKFGILLIVKNRLPQKKFFYSL